MAKLLKEVSPDETNEELNARHDRHEFILSELVSYNGLPARITGECLQKLGMNRQRPVYTVKYWLESSQSSFSASALPEELSPGSGVRVV